MEQGLRFNISTYLHDLAGSEPIPKMCTLALWICCSCEIIRNNKWQTHPAWILAWFLFPTYPCPLGRTVTFCRYVDFFSLSACFCHRYFLRVRGGRFCVRIRMEYNPVQNTISRYFFRRLCHCMYLGGLYKVRCHEPHSSLIFWIPHNDTRGSCEVKLHNLIVHSLRNCRWCRFPAPYTISPLHLHLVYYCLCMKRIS